MRAHERLIDVVHTVKDQVTTVVKGSSVRTRVIAALVTVAVVAVVMIVIPGGNPSDSSDASSPVDDSRESVVMDPLPDTTDGVAVPVAPVSVSAVSYSPDTVDRRILVQVVDGFDPFVLVASDGPLAGGVILEQFDAVGNMAAIELPDGVSATDAAAVLSDIPGVVSAEPDGVVNLDTAGTQENPIWNLSRVDQPTLPVDTVFNYRSQGAGVRAYVVDTGLRSTHVEFTGRVVAGHTVIDDGRGTEECTDNLDTPFRGHGTHVAGTIAGTTYGVAKAATVVPVRVFDCAGIGTWSGAISALNWIGTNHPAGAPAVVNMSLGGSANASMDTATQSLIDAGLVVTTSAGNDNVDACTKSPARVAGALTVGATNVTDTRASFSNFGTCVNVFAPGVSITSSFIESDRSTADWGGTSMAAPHVAGVAAQLLALTPTATPAQIFTTITTSATPTVINAGAGSPNRLLFANPNIVAAADATTTGITGVANATHSFHTVSGTPATIYKRDLSTNTVTASLVLGSGENAVGSAIISADGNTGYFATNTSPAKVVKVNLTNMTRVSDVVFDASENYSHAAVISADSSTGHFATGDSPAKIVTVDLATMTRVAGTALTYADGIPRSGARATAIIALFGTNTSPGKVVQVAITAAAATRSNVLTLQAGENDLRSAVAVPGTSMVFFGTNTSPGAVVRVGVDLVLGRQGSLTLESGDNNLVSATISPNKAHVYFTTNTNPGRVIKVPTGV